MLPRFFHGAIGGAKSGHADLACGQQPGLLGHELFGIFGHPGGRQMVGQEPVPRAQPAIAIADQFAFKLEALMRFT